MILKRFCFIAIVIVAMLGFQSCNNDDGSSTNNTSSIQLKLIDAPGDYLEVNVNIIDIQYNSSDNEEGWMSFGEPDDYPIEVDLTELIAGNDLLLADQIIPSGMLKQIRLVLGEGNNLVIEGEEEPITVPLNTPSALQSGLKLNLNTVLEPDFSYVFIFDWDVQESIVEAGTSGNYNLKPVIKVNAEVNSGSISGNVTGDIEGDGIDDAIPLENVTVQVLTAANVYVTSTLTNENGDFLIQGLDEGAYNLKIERDGFELYESSEAITVNLGVVNNVGIIELIPDN